MTEVLNRNYITRNFLICYCLSTCWIVAKVISMKIEFVLVLVQIWVFCIVNHLMPERAIFFVETFELANLLTANLNLQNSVRNVVIFSSHRFRLRCFLSWETSLIRQLLPLTRSADASCQCFVLAVWPLSVEHSFGDCLCHRFGQIYLSNCKRLGKQTW